MSERPSRRVVPWERRRLAGILPRTTVALETDLRSLARCGHAGKRQSQAILRKLSRHGGIAGSALWDAKTDLNDDSAMVVFTITAIEDGLEGDVFRSPPERAGNTPVTVQFVDVLSSDDRIFVSFGLKDEESDTVDLRQIEISLDGIHFELLPEPLFDALRKDDPSAPPPDGALGKFDFRISEEVHRDLKRGFLGDISVRITVADFDDEIPFSSKTGSTRVDLNDPASASKFAFLSRQAEIALGSD